MVDIIAQIERKLNSRTFRDSKDYIQFSEIKKRYLQCLTIAQDAGSVVLNYENMVRLIRSAYYLYKFPLPNVFAVKECLLDLLTLTDLPNDLQAIKLPLDTAIILFPKSNFVDADKDAYDFVLINTTGKNLPSQELTSFCSNLFQDPFLKIGLNPHVNVSSIAYHIEYTSLNQKSLPLSGGFSVNLDGTVNFKGDWDLTAKKVAKTILQLLFYLQLPAQQQLIADSQPVPIDTTKLTRKERQRAALSNFIWLDADEKIKKQYKASNSAGGTHNSPIAHWRRGYWRNQPVGEKRQDSKLVWIRPTLVSSDVSTESEE